MEKLRDRVREWNRRRKVAQLDRQAQRERDKDRLVVMGIAKNEGRNIDEWIEHYYWQGASKIVLIDNGSTDDTVARAEGWKARGASIEILISPQRHLQTEHYKRAFRSLHLERDYEWLLVADLDEFWFCKNGDTVASALQDFSGLDLIYVNWTHFGSDGHIAHPDSLRTNLLTRRPELASHGVTKWAARTSALQGGKGISIHRPRFISSSRVVSDNQRFQLNHYVVQSEEFFFGVKAKRGSAATAINDRVRTKAYFENANKGCTMRDTALADQVAAAHATAGEPTERAHPTPKA